MPLFRSSKILIAQIDEFLDQVGEGALVFKEGVRSFLAGDLPEFENRLAAIAAQERRADKLSKEVEAHLYSHSLIPDHRGDVLGLLENTDNIMDTAKSSLQQFAVERPVIPAEFQQGYLRLAETSSEAADAAVCAARAFFRDVAEVKDYLYKVHHYEHEADALSDSLKRRIFAADLELAHKTQLRYFAHTVEDVSDMAEEVADRLAIYAIKRNL